MYDEYSKYQGHRKEKCLGKVIVLALEEVVSIKTDISRHRLCLNLFYASMYFVILKVKFYSIYCSQVIFFWFVSCFGYFIPFYKGVYLFSENLVGMIC